MSNLQGNIKHGGHGTLTYARWKSMMARCHQENSSKYRYYGAIGITVCERWHDFSAFFSDMGACPDKSLTLDRILNNRGYEPGNCRWVTRAEQNANRSNVVYLRHNGVTKNITEWAAEIGMSANALAMRIRLGWTVERALTQPLKARSAK